MKHAWIVPVLTVLLGGCAATGSSASATAGASGPAKDEARERQELEQKLEIARARLAVAQLEEKAFEQQQEVRIRQATAELDMARAKLALFRDADMPNRLASEKLDLQASKDRAQEAADELAQIEIMYKDQDLDDLTAEFVVSRGRRAAERAKAQIEIQEAKLTALEKSELPQQERRLALEVDKADAELKKLGFEGQIGSQGKAIAVQEAKNEVERLEDQLAKMEKGAKP